MNSIITYLLLYNQYLLKQISQLLLFIAKHIPLKQWAFDDSHSPEYQKFKVDKLPKIFIPETVDYLLLLAYYQYKYGKTVKPVKHKSDNPISKTIVCPRCGAPHQYLYKNNGSKGQYLCKVCNERFNETNIFNRPLSLRCPYCGHILVPKKDRKHFRIHKCTNSKCSYYRQNLAKLPKNLKPSDKHKYKLHYLYREFTIDFFKMDLHTLPKQAVSFNFKKFNPHIMGLCLTYHVNLKLSSRQTAHALEEVHGIKISHTMVANYAMTAATVIKPFTDTFDYKPANILSADETYIKVKGIKHYVWIIMDACKKSILGYQVSDNRAVGPCILAMRMAFDKFKSFPAKALKFIADGYSAYPLASQQCKLEKGWDFDVTQVIGLTNDDAVSKEFRWVKQVVERLNRTFKSSYRVTCGYDSENGALYGVSLWVAYYNFLRPHPYNYWKPLNELDMLKNAGNMPAKWQLLIYLGQQTILNMQKSQTM
ncbi:MAG: DDE-type integrase/transposase/recombinase [Clostridia bacterium]|nr:DDE-type integrase/transposase/recombinase [Clostridia bacterium]